MFTQTMNTVEKLLIPIRASRLNEKSKQTKANRMPFASSAIIGNSRGRTVGVQVNDKNVSKRKKLQRINQSPWTTLQNNPKGKTVCTEANKTQHIRQDIKLQRASHIQIVSILGQDSPELKFLEQELPYIESSHSSSPKSSFESSENSDYEKTLNSTSEKTSETQSNTEKPLNYQFEIVKKISDEFLESTQSSKYDYVSSKIDKIKANLTIEKCSQFEIINKEANNFLNINENILIPILENITVKPEQIKVLSQLRKIQSTLYKNILKRSNSINSEKLSDNHFNILNQNDENKLINTFENNPLSNDNSNADNFTILKKMHPSISQSHNEFNDIYSEERMNTIKPEDIPLEQEIILDIEQIENKITGDNEQQKQNQEQGVDKEMKNYLLEAINTLTFQELVQLMPLVALRLDLQPNIRSEKKLKIFRKVLKILTTALSSNKID